MNKQLSNYANRKRHPPANCLRALERKHTRAGLTAGFYGVRRWTRIRAMGGRVTSICKAGRPAILQLRSAGELTVDTIVSPIAVKAAWSQVMLVDFSTAMNPQVTRNQSATANQRRCR